MIIQTTYNGTDYYIDSELILYGYDDSGLVLVLNQDAIRYNPATEIFASNSLQAVTVPTYANFVLDTSDFHFLEVSHATHGTICVNLDRIKRLEDVGGTDTNILFEIGASIEVDVPIGTLEAAINNALAPTIPPSTITSTSTNYTILTTDEIIKVTAASITITLPTAVGIEGKVFTITNASSGNITVATTGGQTISGATSGTLSQWDSLVVYSDNSNYIIT